MAAIVPGGDFREEEAAELARRNAMRCWRLRDNTGGGAAAQGYTGEGAPQGYTGGGAPLGSTGGGVPLGAHVVWRLVDGAALLRRYPAAADALFGCGMGGGVWPLISESRPVWYEED